jgi:hypothetical protein
MLEFRTILNRETRRRAPREFIDSGVVVGFEFKV